MPPWMKMYVELQRQWMQIWMGYMTASMKPFSGQNETDFTVNFPFANGFSQRIDPSTNWGVITKARTDHPELEKEILMKVGSYGRQLGRIMDVLIDTADRVDGVDPEALEQLRALKVEIDALKAARLRRR